MPPTSVRVTRDFDAAIAGNLLLQLLVEVAFELANLPAANAGDVDVVARTVGFVEMAVAAKVKQIEFVNQAEMLEKFEGAIDGDAVDIGVDLLRDIEDFSCVHVARGGFHHLDHDAALPGQANAARFQFTLEMARGLAGIDSFSG